MAFTYNLATDLGKTRLLAVDTDAASFVFEDEELHAFLGLAGGSVFLAAALALDYIAGDAAKCAVVTKSDVLATDPTKISELVANRAKTLREQAGSDPTLQAAILSGAMADGPDPIFTTSHRPGEISSMDGW